MFQNLTFMSPFKHVTPINNNNELNMTDYWRSIVQQWFFQTSLSFFALILPGTFSQDKVLQTKSHTQDSLLNVLSDAPL